VLRLLVRGHDIKSIARELSISTTAAHERLRAARQKLSVSSSREAARVLDAAEGSPNFPVDSETGVPFTPDRSQSGRIAFVWIGMAMAVAIATSIVLMFVVGSHGSRAGAAGAPKVVRTAPVSGAMVAPGALNLSVTYDRPMRPGNFSFVQKDPATYPDCGHSLPAQSQDGRTFTMSCTVEPGRSYEVWFNSPPYMNFKDLDGTPAVSFQLSFRTKGR
jgi:hypothetical protein